VNIDWSYAPPGPVVRKFMQSGAFVRGIRGPIGSGKSTACVMDLLARAMAQAPSPDGIRRSRWAIIRNTYPELKTTTIKTWHQWVPPEVGRWQAEGPPTHHIRTRDVDIEVMFLALDRPEDIRKLLSLELTGAWINEAREVPKAILDALTGRVGRYPGAMLGGATWCGVIMDTNPPDSDHWWYRLAEEMHPEGYEFFSQPAGDAPGAENVDNLPPGYYARAKAGKDEDWIKVYVRGEYGFVQDGKPVVHEYRDHVHCADLDPLPKVPLMVGIDFGLTPAAVIMQRRPNGVIAWLDELVAEDMGARRFGEVLKAKMARDFNGFAVEFVGDPAGDQRAQTDESTPFIMLRAVGVPARPASTNEFNVRREAIGAPLSRMVDGSPGMVVHSRCTTARKGLAGGYCFRRVQVAGHERYHDVPEKNRFSHVVDAGGYGMLGLGEGSAVMRSPLLTGPRQTEAISDVNPRGRWEIRQSTALM